jgi:hypothetical protein
LLIFCFALYLAFLRSADEASVVSNGRNAHRKLRGLVLHRRNLLQLRDNVNALVACRNRRREIAILDCLDYNLQTQKAASTGGVNRRFKKQRSTQGARSYLVAISNRLDLGN